MPEAPRPPTEPGAGVAVRLADGRSWPLPAAAELAGDPRLAPLLAGIDEAADADERLRAELALTVHLLIRSGVEPAELERLLSFGPDAAGRRALQDAVHGLARSLQEGRRPLVAARHGPEPSRGRTSALARWLRALWPLGTT